MNGTIGSSPDWIRAEIAPASRLQRHMYRDFHGIEPPLELTFDQRTGSQLRYQHFVHSEECPCRKAGQRKEAHS